MTLGLIVTVLGCALRGARPTEEVATRPIEAVLNDHARELMAVPGVAGVGIGRCQGLKCIRVLVVQQTPQLVARLPTRLEGYLVDVVETGEIHAR